MPQTAAVTRLTLMPALPPQRLAGAPRVRRYRLARLASQVPATGAERYAYLKRTYD
jgi:hypothetical protein